MRTESKYLLLVKGDTKMRTQRLPVVLPITYSQC